MFKFKMHKIDARQKFTKFTRETVIGASLSLSFTKTLGR